MRCCNVSENIEYKIYENNNKGLITDIERYDKYSLLVILGKKEYLIPYNDNLIDNIDIVSHTTFDNRFFL